MLLQRNVLSLFIAQIFGATATNMMVLIGGILGMQMATNKHWSTAPMALLVIGAAVFALPSASIMRRFGRKQGFISAALLSLLACIIASAGIALHSFLLFCLSAFLIGVNSIFILQYRFAVIEGLAQDTIAKAVSILLLGNMISIIISSQAAILALDLFRIKYLGLFVVEALLLCLSIAALFFYKNVHLHANPVDNITLPKQDIVFYKHNLVPAIIVASTSYFVMSLIMVATPVVMHGVHHMPVKSTSLVIQWHLLAMYMPSLIVGSLINRWGCQPVITFGSCLLLLSLLVNLMGFSYWHCTIALILLGAGWNLTFIGGTTVLTQSYDPAHRFKYQAINDLFVFSCAALASLSSGSLVYWLGWNKINLIGLLIVMPIMTLALVKLYLNKC